MHESSTQHFASCFATVFFVLFLGLMGAFWGTTECLAQTRFSDDFESDLSSWQLVGGKSISIEDSGSEEHGRVMVLRPNGSVLALIPESDRWGPVRFEFDVLFPDDDDNYLGIIYNYTDSGHRTDFGSLYIKGNGSYIRANPWRDGNVSRLLYEEFKTRLEGDDAIEIGTWHRVKAEVAGRDCHLYVGDMETPKVTFGLYEGDSGLLGVNPRVAGWPVWIDNVEVTSIDRLSYQGPDLPAIDYEPEKLVTDWQVSGPFPQPMPRIESSNDPQMSTVQTAAGPQTWRDFETDPRGAVVSGRITEYDGDRPVAYFRTVINADADGDGDGDGDAILHLSSLDEIAMWVNGEFYGYVYRNGYVFGERDWNAWHDFYKNPEHEGGREPIELRAGANQILLRVRNGQFASGGFFARLEFPKQNE